MRIWRVLIVWALLAAPVAGPVAAQQAVTQPVSPVLIIDSERLFFETLYGKRISADLAAAAAALQAENDRIAADLTREERSLTERRPGMDPVAFRAEAAAFDARVQDVRRDRDARNVALQSDTAAARAAFQDRVQEIVGQVMLERGAVMVLEQRNVILSVRAANITDAVIARIDADLDTGQP